jgi:hypothetical protein
MERPDSQGFEKSRSRRKYSRVGTDRIISFAPIDDRDLQAVSRDVSPGGIRFEAIGCEIELGEILRVTFSIQDQVVVAIGRVAWATELDAMTTDVGVEFVEVDSEVLELLDQAAPSESLG